MEHNRPADWISTGTETVRGDDRDIVLTIARAPIDDLEPDTDNTRLHHIRMSKYDGKEMTREQCFEELWRLSSVKKLKQGIELAGGLSEALYVREDGTVMEGNERLTALNRVKKDLQIEGNYESERRAQLEELIENIPIKVLPSDITRKELMMMMADWHLNSKDPWPAVNQAKHVHDMWEENGLNISDISHRLRKSRAWVHQKIYSYELAKNYFDTEDKWDSPQDFSYFEEAWKKKKALSASGLDIEHPDGQKTFMKWVSQKQIPRALDVRKLDKVLRYKDTKELLYAGRGQEAFKQLKFFDAAETSPRFASIVRMRGQLQKISLPEIKMIAEQPHLRQLLEDSISELTEVLMNADNYLGREE